MIGAIIFWAVILASIVLPLTLTCRLPDSWAVVWLGVLTLLYYGWWRAMQGGDGPAMMFVAFWYFASVWINAIAGLARLGFILAAALSPTRYARRLG